MEAVLDSFLAGFPVLMAHSATTLALLFVAVLIYMWITPWDELALVRGGNVAAAVSFGGAIVGLALPLAFAMAASVSIYEILIWGVVTLALQIIAYRFADLVLKVLPARIEAGEMGAAVLLVSIKLAAAAINAAVRALACWRRAPAACPTDSTVMEDASTFSHWPDSSFLAATTRTTTVSLADAVTAIILSFCSTNSVRAAPNRSTATTRHSCARARAIARHTAAWR